MPGFVEVARFATRLEAETVGHALDQYQIPFVVKADDAGGVYVDLAMAGAALCVPEDKIRIVTELLSCVVKPPPEEEDNAESED